MRKAVKGRSGFNGLILRQNAIVVVTLLKIAQVFTARTRRSGIAND
jgi:hypothetical protein